MPKLLRTREPERVREIDRIPARVAVEIQSPRQLDRVLLRTLTRRSTGPPGRQSQLLRVVRRLRPFREIRKTSFCVGYPATCAPALSSRALDCQRKKITDASR